MALISKDGVGVSPSKVAPAGTSGSSGKCGSCGSTSIDVDPSRAEAVCTNCGDVIEASNIVADVQFEENAHGGSSAIGQFVHSDSKGGATGAGVSGAFGRGGGPGGFGAIAGIGRESREITLRNARNKIKALGQQLQLRQDRIDMAFNFFRMALSRNLTRGRKSTHVVAACVYITCRTEGTSHMLIDFSDILQIDVYELGRTYLRLSQELCINIPAMDPCLYVMRFAHKLEFGEKTHEVSMTALRLVSRMKKDWIHFGRRPSGLCGAALLIAARLHSFHRTVPDVIKVVKVHESTLRKRLSEFGETPASQLTLDEFMSVDLDAMTEEQDPPSFKAARRKDREQALLAALTEEQWGEVDDEISDLEQKIERILEEQRRARAAKGPFAKEALASLKDKAEEAESQRRRADETDAEDEQTERFIAEQTVGTINDLVEAAERLESDSSTQGSSNHKKLRKNSADDPDQALMPPPAAKGVVTTPGLGLKDTIQEYLMSSSPSSSSGSGGAAGTGEVRTKKEEQGEDEDGAGGGSDGDSDGEGAELDLEGIDDEEIDSYIMSDAEIRCKTEIWMKINAEYLKEKAEKEERERREEEEAIKEGREVKKKKSGGGGGKGKKKNLGGHRTAIDAIEKIVQEKKMSTKINYDVLRSLNAAPLSSPASPMKRPPAGDEEEGASGAADGTGSVCSGSEASMFGGDSVAAAATAGDQIASVLSPTLSRFAASPAKRLKREASSRKSSMEEGSSQGTPAASPAQPEPIVETGPIRREAHEEDEGAHEEEEELDEDEEDVSTMSAAQLLSKHMGEGGGGGDEEYYEEEYY